MLVRNNLDKGTSELALHDVKEHSFTRIKCLILEYLGSSIENEGQQVIDSCVKILFYSRIGICYL